jgi:hypothetical protein
VTAPLRPAGCCCSCQCFAAGAPAAECPARCDYCCCWSQHCCLLLLCCCRAMCCWLLQGQ